MHTKGARVVVNTSLIPWLQVILKQKNPIRIPKDPGWSLPLTCTMVTGYIKKSQRDQSTPLVVITTYLIPWLQVILKKKSNSKKAKKSEKGSTSPMRALAGTIKGVSVYIVMRFSTLQFPSYGILTYVCIRTYIHSYIYL